MRRSRVETAFAALFVALAVLTSIWPAWMEAIGFDPDHGNGSAEWAIVAAFGALAVVSALLARRHYRMFRLAED
jgi:hypothetical protein